MLNAKRRLEWCKAHSHWTLEQWNRFSRVMSTGQIWVWLMPGEATHPNDSANCNVWWRLNNFLGLFFMVWARSLNSSEGKS
jgi:hypothetical protein